MNRGVQIIPTQTALISSGALGIGGNTVVFTTPSDARFWVYHLFICTNNATVLTFRSGTTSIALSRPLAAPDVFELKNGEQPIFIGRTFGETFNITTSLAATLTGFAVVATQDRF